MIPNCRHQGLTIVTRHPNSRLPRAARPVNRSASGGWRYRRDVTCKSRSPVCNGDGCFARPPMVRIRIRGSVGVRGPAARGQPQRIVRRRPEPGARVFQHQAISSRERANAACFVFLGQARRRSGQMSGHTTPHRSSVNRQYLRDCAGLLARPDFPSRLSVSIEHFPVPDAGYRRLLLLQHAGSRRPMRGAPARGSGSLSAARRVSLAAAPMEDSYGQQDAHRCHPSGGDPGRGGARLAYRGI
jgi:hypothetical protein